MRYFILTILLFVNIQLSSAQLLWEKVYSEKHRFSSYTLDAAVFSDSILLITGVPEYPFSCEVLFVALDSSGEEMWSHDHVYSEYDCEHFSCYRYSSIRWVATTENSIYTCGDREAGDVVTGDETWSIHKFAPSGELLFATPYPITAELDRYNMHTTGIIADEEWGVIVSAAFIGGQADRITKFDTDGNFLWDMQYDFHIDQVVFTKNGDFSIRTESHVILASSMGEIQDTFELDQPAISMVYLDQKLYLATFGEVFSLNIDTGEKESILFNIPENHFSLLNVFNDSLWVLSEGSNMAYVTNVLSEGMLEYSLPLPAIFIQNFFITGNEIIFTGSNLQGIMAVIAYGREDIHLDVSWPDIELIDFEISNTEIMYVTDAPWEGIVNGFRFDTQITIRNNGDEPIEWFWLQSDRQGGFDCGWHYYYELFEDFTIDPQQERTFDIGPTTDYQNPGTNTRVCYKVIAPNSRLESNVANNQICKTYDITSVPETLASHEWKAYPNPAMDQIKLHLTGKTETPFEIWDIRGSLMLSGQMEAGEKTIDISSLPGGIYLLRVFDETRNFTQKIIKN